MSVLVNGILLGELLKQSERYVMDGLHPRFVVEVNAFNYNAYIHHFMSD